VPVKKGKMHVLRVVREILFYKPKRKRTRLASAMEYLHRFLTRSAVIFIISDFIDENYEKPLKILSRRHDVIAVHLKDRREKELVPAGLIEIEDGETGERMLVDTSDPRVREAYRARSAEADEKLDRLFKVMGVDKVDIAAEGSYVEPLMKFFKIREQRL